MGIDKYYPKFDFSSFPKYYKHNSSHQKKPIELLHIFALKVLERPELVYSVDVLSSFSSKPKTSSNLSH